MMDHRLEIFIKVADMGNITTVAADLFVSQPAISKQIKILEKELNVKLFHRDKRNGMILTDVGQKILLLAKQQAEIDNRIYQAAFRESNIIGGNLRIASLPILSANLLSKVLPIYRKKYPQVTVEITEGTPREVRQMVLDRTVDFGVSCSPFAELDHEILFHDRMIGFYPADAENMPEEIDLRKGTENLIFSQPGKEIILEELSGKHKISFSKSLLFENPYTVVQMVLNGNGIGILSKFTVDAIPNRLQTCDVVPHFDIEIGIEASSLKDLTPVANEFYKILKDVTGSLTPSK